MSILTFANDGVEEIYTTKGTSDDGVDIAVGAFEANEGVSSNMREDVSLTHFDESQFAVVAVGEEVCRRQLTCILTAFMDPMKMKRNGLSLERVSTNEPSKQ